MYIHTYIDAYIYVYIHTHMYIDIQSEDPLPRSRRVPCDKVANLRNSKFWSSRGTQIQRLWAQLIHGLTMAQWLEWAWMGFTGDSMMVIGMIFLPAKFIWRWPLLSTSVSQKLKVFYSWSMWPVLEGHIFKTAWQNTNNVLGSDVKSATPARTWWAKKSGAPGAWTVGIGCCGKAAENYWNWTFQDGNGAATNSCPCSKDMMTVQMMRGLHLVSVSFIDLWCIPSSNPQRYPCSIPTRPAEHALWLLLNCHRRLFKFVLWELPSLTSFARLSVGFFQDLSTKILMNLFQKSFPR